MASHAWITMRLMGAFALAALGWGCHLIGGTEGLYIEEPAAGGMASSVAESTGSGSGAAGGGTTLCDSTSCPGSDTGCSKRACIDNACGFVNEDPGTTCTDEGGTVCDGGGRCVECVANGNCPANSICLDYACHAPSCDDNIFQQSSETDIDCGNTCAPCDNGRMCLAGSDCKSTLCSGGFCTGCTAHGDCATALWYCELPTGFCKAKKSIGQACTQGYECLTGYCYNQLFCML